jgi:hypothetical protein
MVRVTVPVRGFHKMIACLDSLAASVVADRMILSSTVIVVVPATAESRRAVMLVLTNVPQLVVPSAGSDRPRRGVDAI